MRAEAEAPQIIGNHRKSLVRAEAEVPHAEAPHSTVGVSARVRSVVVW